jgi:hypothetical protein
MPIRVAPRDTVGCRQPDQAPKLVSFTDYDLGYFDL